MVLVTAFRESLMLSASMLPLNGGFAKHMVNAAFTVFSLDTLSR